MIGRNRHLVSLKMIYSIVIIVVVQSTFANGFLDECPIDRTQRIGNDLVIDVLGTFYKDLVFVQACTKSQLPRNYSSLMKEIKYLADIDKVEPDKIFTELVRLLEENRVSEAGSLLVNSDAYAYSTDWTTSFCDYFQLEILRLSDNFAEAIQTFSFALSSRRDTVGVSMNQLERLDGLLALKKVSEFNKDVDRYYGLRDSANYQTLPLVYSLFKDELESVDKMRSQVYNRLFWRDPSIALSSGVSPVALAYGMKRLNPDLDDFSGNSVSQGAAEGMLCELAQKIALLGVSTRTQPKQSTSADYSKVIDQLRRLDAEFAKQLQESVVDHIDKDLELAKDKAHDMWVDMVYASNSTATYDDIQRIFVGYFDVELYRRSEDRCNLWSLNVLQADLNLIKILRQKQRGVSLAVLAELEGKFLLDWLDCFHKRVALAFRLDGSEDELQLKSRRSKIGAACEKTIPDSSIFHSPLFGTFAISK